MGPSDAPSSPTFPALDPIIMDDEMESTFRNANMDFLDPTKLEIPSGSAGGDFDDLFAHVTHSRSNAAPESSKAYQDQHPLRHPPLMAAESPAESPDNSSRSSSSESPRNHHRHASVASTNSAAHSENPLTSAGFSTEDWMRPELSSVKEESPFTIEPSYPMDGFSMDPDLESSNKAMDAAFDFESAASSPSPLKTENPPQPSPPNASQSQFWSPATAPAAAPSNEAPVATRSSVSHGIEVFWQELILTFRSRPRLPDRPSSLLVSKNSLHSRAHFVMIRRGWLLHNGAPSLRHHCWKKASAVLT